MKNINRWQEIIDKLNKETTIEGRALIIELLDLIVLELKDVRKYIWNSFLSMKKLKHKIIMLMLLIAPKLVITTYYRQWR